MLARAILSREATNTFGRDHVLIQGSKVDQLLEQAGEPSLLVALLPVAFAVVLQAELVVRDQRHATSAEDPIITPETAKPKL